MVAVSCYVAGLQPPIPAHRFGNTTRLALAAGMPIADLAKTRSSRFADYYGVAHPPLQAHDALDDALSLAYALQHLLKTDNLPVDAFFRQ
jgi:DNA polymerase III epsilon subunit-like protein